MEPKCGLLLGMLVLAAGSWSASGATKTFDFEGSAYGTPDQDCINNPLPPLFNHPGFGYQTSAYLVGSAGCYGGFYNGTQGSNSLLTAAIGANGSQSDELHLSWADPTNSFTWARVPAYLAGGVTPKFISPTVYIGVGGSIRMDIAIFGTNGVAPEQANPAGQLEFVLCIRETGAAVPLGENGGMTGTVEFCGVDSSQIPPGGSDPTPVGGVVLTSAPEQAAIAESFRTVEWKFVDRNGDGAVDGVDVTVDGATTARSVVRFSGDGILSAPGDRGTLDSLAIIKPVSDDETKKWYVWVDNIVINAPGIVDMVKIITPVMSYMTEATVSLIDENASEVRLYKDDVLYRTQAFTPGSAPSSYTFSGCVFAKDDKLEATQVVDGVAGAKAAPVFVRDRAFFSDSFDGYADTAALYTAWPRTSIQADFNMTLSMLKVASCRKSVLEPASSAIAPSRLYRDLGSSYDGTDAIPLTLTVWMNHAAGLSARNYVELRSYTGGGYNQGTLQQLLAIGIYNAAGLDLSLYQGRMALGASSPDWFNVTGALRTPDTWVKLQIKVKTGTVDFIVDGTHVVTYARLNPLALFNTVVLGSGLTNGGVEAFYDNVSVSLGEPPTDPFGGPNTISPPVLIGPVTPASTTVVVDALDPAASQVRIYGNDTVVAYAPLVGETSKIITVPAMTCGTVVTATQVLGAVESCYSSAVPVVYPVPTVQAGLVTGTAALTVNEIDPTATLVKVYVDNVVAGSAPVSGEASRVVTVEPALAASQMVEATQVINGIECGRSLPVTVIDPILTSWIQTSSLPVGLTDHSLVYHNGYVYCLGGRSDVSSIATDGVYYAPVNGDGSLGAWQTAVSLPGLRAAAGAAGCNGRLYVWGGWRDDWATMNTCWYAPQNADGSLGTWTPSAVTIPNSSDGVTQMEAFGRGLLVLGDVLYVINGRDDKTTQHTSCYYSRVTGGGDFGAWSNTAATDLPRWYHGLAVIQGMGGNRIYQVGGITQGTASPKTARGSILSDGSLGAWATEAEDLPQERYAFGCATADNRVFVVAGLDNHDTPHNSVYYTIPDPSTGAIARWKDVAVYPRAVGRNAAVGYMANSSWYVLGAGGGPFEGGLRETACYYARLNVCSTPRQDADGDGDVDLTDFQVFQSCFNGPNRPFSGSGGQLGRCGCFDVDPAPNGDGDVDLTDFGMFQACFNGPNRSPALGCGT